MAVQRKKKHEKFGLLTNASKSNYDFGACNSELLKKTWRPMLTVTYNNHIPSRKIRICNHVREILHI